MEVPFGIEQEYASDVSPKRRIFHCQSESILYPALHTGQTGSLGHAGSKTGRP